jgi:hypothetical protein
MDITYSMEKQGRQHCRPCRSVAVQNKRKVQFKFKRKL